MKKQGKINIKGTLQGNTNTPGHERTAAKEFSFEEVAPSVLANDKNTFLETFEMDVLLNFHLTYYNL